MRISAALPLLILVAILGCGGQGAGSGVTGGGSSGSGGTTATTGGGTTTTGGAGTPDLGIGANMNGYRPFPSNNAWNTPVDAEPVDPNSATLIASIGAAKAFHPDFGADLDGAPFGIPYMVVDNSTPAVPMQFDYADESDPGPYPFPANAPVEGGNAATGDRHVLVINRDTKKLYETFDSHRQSNGSWQAAQGQSST